MLPRPVLLVLFSAFVASTNAALDLTPAVNEIVEQAVTYREVSFKTPGGKVLFTLPPGWTIRGEKNRAQLSGGNPSAAEALIEAIPLLKPEPLESAAIAKFKEQVIAALPPGATKITAVYEAENSLMPSGSPSFEFVITYDLWGKIFQRSALLVNGPQDRLVFRFTSSKQDFASLNTQFRRSIMSWRTIAANESPKSAVASAGGVPAAN